MSKFIESEENIVPVSSTIMNNSIADNVPTTIPRDLSIREAIKPARNADTQEEIIAAANTAVCDKDFILSTKNALKNSINISTTPPNNPPKITARVIVFIVICCDFSFLTENPSRNNYILIVFKRGLKYDVLCSIEIILHLFCQRTFSS